MSIEQLAAEQFDVFLSYTLPKTNSSPLKIGRLPPQKDHLPLAPFFSGATWEANWGQNELSWQRLFQEAGSWVPFLEARHGTPAILWSSVILYPQLLGV